MTSLLSISSALALGPSWMNPDTLLHNLGDWALWGAVAIVFAECGLLIGFFLPGDSLLFTVGLLIAGNTIHQPLWVACIVLTIASFVGNVAGYQIGRVSGPAVFSRNDSRIFKRQYVDRTVAFFDRYGTRAVLLARFVPIVRTFITVMAGVGRMDRRRYLTYSAIGGTVWAAGVTALGAALGQVTFVKQNIDLILVAIVLASVVPIAIEVLRERAKAARAELS
jgi:membrane-associated protein